MEIYSLIVSIHSGLYNIASKEKHVKSLVASLAASAEIMKQLCEAVPNVMEAMPHLTKALEATLGAVDSEIKGYSAAADRKVLGCLPVGRAAMCLSGLVPVAGISGFHQRMITLSRDMETHLSSLSLAVEIVNAKASAEDTFPHLKALQSTKQRSFWHMWFGSSASLSSVENFASILHCAFPIGNKMMPYVYAASKCADVNGMVTPVSFAAELKKEEPWAWFRRTFTMTARSGFFAGGSEAITCMDTHGDTLVVGCADRFVKIIRNNVVEVALAGHNASVDTVAIGGACHVHIVSTSKDKNVRVWSAVSGRLVHNMSLPERAISTAITKDAGTSFAVLLGRRVHFNVYVYDTHTGQLTAKFASPNVDTTSLSWFSRDSALFMVSACGIDAAFFTGMNAIDAKVGPVTAALSHLEQDAWRAPSGWVKTVPARIGTVGEPRNLEINGEVFANAPSAHGMRLYYACGNTLSAVAFPRASASLEALVSSECKVVHTMTKFDFGASSRSVGLSASTHALSHAEHCMWLVTDGAGRSRRVNTVTVVAVDSASGDTLWSTVFSVTQHPKVYSDWRATTCCVRSVSRDRVAVYVGLDKGTIELFEVTETAAVRMGTFLGCHDNVVVVPESIIFNSDDPAVSVISMDDRSPYALLGSSCPIDPDLEDEPQRGVVIEWGFAVAVTRPCFASRKVKHHVFNEDRKIITLEKRVDATQCGFSLNVMDAQTHVTISTVPLEGKPYRVMACYNSIAVVEFEDPAGDNHCIIFDLMENRRSHTFSSSRILSASKGDDNIVLSVLTGCICVTWDGGDVSRAKVQTHISIGSRIITAAHMGGNNLLAVDPMRNIFRIDDIIGTPIVKRLGRVISTVTNIREMATTSQGISEFLATSTRGAVFVYSVSERLGVKCIRTFITHPGTCTYAQFCEDVIVVMDGSGAALRIPYKPHSRISRSLDLGDTTGDPRRPAIARDPGQGTTHYYADCHACESYERCVSKISMRASQLGPVKPG
eukprot:jgi/Tetstr1/453923/TSEL_040842.t1